MNARERRTGKPPKLRIVLDHRLIEEAHAAAFADQVPDELEAADADIGVKCLDRVAALLELSFEDLSCAGARLAQDEPLGKSSSIVTSRPEKGWSFAQTPI